ncbi:MAG: T9SS type A sorting domain-containing protein, partial [Cyclobacteriaceae bacterium]
TNLQKVESYLAIKYGITLDQTVNQNYLASNSAVVFPATSSLPDYQSYANDIFGIARDDQSTLDQTKSKSVNSDNIMTITNGNDPDNPASFTNNFTFLMVGNDNDDDGTIEEITTELPPNVTARLDREWRAAVTGNLGEVTLQFDVTGLGVSGTTVADFKVLVDRDGDFTDGFVQSFDATSYDSGTGIVTITGVSLSDDDVFTLSTGIPPKGPGGVTTGLQLWLRADIGAYQDTGAVTDADTDADPVFRWDDQSNGKQFTNDVFGGISGSSPTFRTDVPGFNFNPAIQFVNDGTENDYLANDGTHTWGSDVTLFGVFQTDGDNGTVISYDVDAGDDEFKLDDLSGVTLEVDEQSLNDFNGQDIADDRSYILAFDYEDGTDEYNLYIDGTADPNNSGSNGTATTIANDGTIVIGNDLNDAGNASTGGMITGSAGPGYDDYIGEMIVYNQVLSPTDRQKVQTYLGLKYGIFVDDGNPDFLSANGTVIYPGGESVFSNDIAGVGRDDLGNFIQPKSKSNESSAILTVEKNEDFNADGQYIVWAHNGESAGDSISSGLPSGIESRKKRVWKVELTNSPTGTVDLTIELGGNPDDVRLLFDASDPTFGSATVVNPSVIDNGDGTFTFQNVNVSNFSDGGYFTVGSVDEDETPLPVELLYFVGAQEADHIQLDWATATEINNDHFEVERSVDGEIWDVIGMVNGFGTTSTPQNYVHVDINPQIGVAYYRLRQVDFDGAFEYSSIIQVSYKFEDFDFNVYPNPFEQSFLIDIRGLSANERIPYRIVDLAGAVIHEGQFTADVNGRFRRQATISGTNAKGVYLFQMLREGQSITYKLIKQ